MLSFENDYDRGAHPQVLQRLLETNLEPAPGYGTDPYCASAREKILAACHCPKGDVRFLTGGTQTNALVIASLLRDHEGVIAADTGHVAAHEAAAVEYTGHKVLPLPQRDGKLSADTVRAFVRAFYRDENREHMVFPGLVYISHPTELGTLYTKAELTALADVCREFHMPLYLDGARLGYGLASPSTDLSLPDIAALCDVFTVGGTKVGALCGEAVVFPRGNTPAHFVNFIKRRGGLLAKGRLLGVQFDALFTNDLYGEIGRHAMAAATRLQAIFEEKGYTFAMHSPTNQQFILVTNEKRQQLAQQVAFSVWDAPDDTHSVLRFCTSWATTDEDLNALARIL